MSGTSLLFIAIPILVFLAVLTVFTTARRRDTERALSLETVKRDRGDSPFLPEQEPVAVATGRDVERAAVVARRSPGTDLATVGPVAPVPYVPPDPETLGVTRRSEPTIRGKSPITSKKCCDRTVNRLVYLAASESV